MVQRSFLTNISLSIVCFLLAMVVIAGLISEVLVAFRTEDPLVEGASWALSAFGTSFCAKVIFDVLESFVA